ncbi:hypothetical protein GCM10022227_27940 [Streptomyces sedi]
MAASFPGVTWSQPAEAPSASAALANSAISAVPSPRRRCAGATSIALKPAHRPSTTHRPTACGGSPSPPATSANSTEGPAANTRRAMAGSRPADGLPASHRAVSSRPTVTRPSGSRSASGANAPTRWRANPTGRQPRASNAATSRSSPSPPPVATRTSGGSPRAAYQATTRSSSGSAGPRRTAELARRVQPPAARSSQSPTRSVSGAGQARVVTCVNSATEAAGTPRLRAGAGGTTLPATSADSANPTVSPDRRVTVSTPPVHEVRIPRVSVNRPPPSPAPVAVRTETRLPTSSGVIRTSSRAPAVNSIPLANPSGVRMAPQRRY